MAIEYNPEEKVLTLEFADLINLLEMMSTEAPYKDAQLSEALYMLFFLRNYPKVPLGEVTKIVISGVEGKIP